MKYVSKESSHPTPSPSNGFWVKEDTVYDVTFSTHVGFVVDNPGLLGLTGKDIMDIYAKHKEIVGAESKAREELVRYAASLGWIRVRHYSRPGNEYWSIQMDNTTRRRDVIYS